MLVHLHGGSRVLLRPVRRDDVAVLLRGLDACSAETLRSRYLSPKPRFTREELAYLTDVDQQDHVAVIAVRADRPEVMAGIGRWVRDADRPERAEVAFLVVDAYHGRGLGSALGLCLADAAVARGVTTLTATLFSENAPSQRILAAIGDRLRKARGGGVDELVLELPEATGRADALAAARDRAVHEQPTLQIRRPAGARRSDRRRPVGSRAAGGRGAALPEDPDWSRRG